MPLSGNKYAATSAADDLENEHQHNYNGENDAFCLSLKRYMEYIKHTDSLNL